MRLQRKHPEMARRPICARRVLFPLRAAQEQRDLHQSAAPLAPPAPILLVYGYPVVSAVGPLPQPFSANEAQETSLRAPESF